MPARRALDLCFALAAFVGSSLIFVVQPIIARQLLPTLGGAPAVWTTCMLFFQTCLLVGYAWAHFGPRWLGDRPHAALHVLLLAGCAFSLPLGIRVGWQPSSDAGPAFAVLAALTLSIGLPMCVLSATSPLVQRWHAAIHPDRGDRVYRLYSVGNIASLLVLLAYPLVIEPTSTLRGQRVAWSWAFGVEAILIAACAFFGGTGIPACVGQRPTQSQARMPVPSRQYLWWILLSAIPSSYLLGVTSYLTSDVAAVPFLWVLPLALYLGAFSLAFAGKRPANFVRSGVAPAAALLCLVLVGMSWTVTSVPLAIGLHVGTFFLLAFGCLSELYRRRPDETGALTAFYLWIAVGGVIGGAFNSLVAPRVFSSTLEYPIALLACAALAILWPARRATNEDGSRASNGVVRGIVLLVFISATLYTIRELRARFSLSPNVVMALLGVPMVLCFASRRRPIAFGLSAGTLLGVLLALGFSGQSAIEVHRSFFGVHRVVLDPDRPFIELYHGTTLHGEQTYDPLARRPVRDDLPLTYYHPDGPLGDLFKRLTPRRVGVVGLGVGNVAAYLNAGQAITYFEIDPAVIALAQRPDLFTFLGGARSRGVDVAIVEGDARLTLARNDVAFDLLVLDAFSGDAIPAHLLTREAFELYAGRLAPAGTLAVHISNRYLDLRDVVAAGGRAIDPQALLKDESILRDVMSTPGRAASIWVVVTRNEGVRKSLEVAGWTGLTAAVVGRGWSDDYTNLLGVLK